MKSTSLLLAGLLTQLSVVIANPPKGWFIAGSKPRSYDISLDRTNAHSGKASGTIRSISEPTGGFGTLMQMALADDYLGTRVRLKAWVKTRDVVDWAGVWFRIDGPDDNKPLGFDNMQNRPLKGTLEWTKCEIVLDVPEAAVNLAYGVLVSGSGQAWLDSIELEKVGSDVPVTDANQKPKRPALNAPASLGFENED